MINKKDKNLINVPFDSKNDIKVLIKKQIKSAIGSEKFHLEQVYTLGENKYYNDNKVDVIYLALTNIENIKKLHKNYELVEFNILNNNKIVFEDKTFEYKTKEKVINNNAEYYHEIKVNNLELEKNY